MIENGITYAGFNDVLRFVKEADDRSLDGMSSYSKFAMWIRPQGITECRRYGTFVYYRWRARKLITLDYV